MMMLRSVAQRKSTASSSYFPQLFVRTYKKNSSSSNKRHSKNNTKHSKHSHFFQHPHQQQIPKANVHSNDWISGLSRVDRTLYKTLSDIKLFEQNKELQTLLEETIWELKQLSRANNFKHSTITESQSSHIEATMKVFEHDLVRSYSDTTTFNKISLSDLLVPTTETLPSLIHSLNNPTPTTSEFFQSKSMEDDPTSQTYYLLERAFYHHLTSVSAHRSPPQRLKVDISNPAEWYPHARRLKRHLILHVGPTNSGKTYNALKRLKESNNGVYAGPLRLLAREAYNRFKSEGFRCNLITGEEVVQDLDEFGVSAPLSCSTVEMVSLNQDMEVAVIDEIQMIADQDRGWAWTNALLGVRAKEVHLCGEASAVPLIEKLAAMTGDKVTINEYNRLGKLVVEKKPIVAGLQGLRRGDCIVVFSKKRILAYKADIERSTKLKVGVIYGALPAETRTEQAHKFNNGEYDVLVASDAIGMGLNLSIRRIIFDNHTKFDGKKMTNLEIPHVKQIGGRAGRFRVAPSGNNKQAAEQKNDTTTETSDGDETVGYVTAFNTQSLKYIDQCMSHGTVMLQKASLWPSDEILSQYISEFPAGTTRSSILQSFKEEVDKVPLYSIGSEKERQTMLDVLENVKGMMIADVLRITTAPLSTRLPKFNAVLFEFAANVTNSGAKTCFDFKSMDFTVLQKDHITMDDLGEMEDLHKYMMVWLWMNNRYPSLFVNRESAVDVKNLIEDKIDDVLSGMKLKGIGGEL